MSDPTGLASADAELLRTINGERSLTEVLTAIAAERKAQIARWGVQNHPDGTGMHFLKGTADRERRACDAAFENGRGTWRHIFAEEVAEAFAERDLVKLRGELVQAAAVAVAWIEAIDRRSM